MTEQRQRQLVVKALKAQKRDPISVENRVYPGTPDVNYVEGWIELKVLEAWPVRASTIVSIDHYTQQQRVWLRRRWLVAKNAWLLLTIKRDWLLFDGLVAFRKVGRVTKSELFEVAFCSWIGQPSSSELVAALDNGELV